MSTVYVVNRGCYSDYHVVAIFSTKQKAKDFMQAVRTDYDDYNDIEEYELDNNVVDLIKHGYSIWNIHMLRNGDTERVERRDSEAFYIESIGFTIWQRSQIPINKDKNVGDVLVAYVWAKDEKHAIKITNEHRAQIIAEGKWK